MNGAKAVSFAVDRNISIKEYEKFGTDLLVTKTFHTIQGEGPYAGYPAFFIRLAGCNRGDKLSSGCKSCDASFEFDKGQVYSLDTLMNEIKACSTEFSLDLPIVVITGGEPLLQEAALTNFCNQLTLNGYKIQIETNGDLLRGGSLPRTHVVMSPKVSGKQRVYKKVKDETLLRIDSLKILVDINEDSGYHDLPEYVFRYADLKGSYNVYISPVSYQSREPLEGEVASYWSDLYDKQVGAANHQYAASLALKYGFRLSLQTHLWIGYE